MVLRGVYCGSSSKGKGKKEEMGELSSIEMVKCDVESGEWGWGLPFAYFEQTSFL